MYNVESMSTTALMLINVIIFVALAIPGFILSKTGIIKDEQSVSFSKLLLYVGIPFLIISKTLEIDFNKEAAEIIVFTALITVVYTFITFFASYPASAMIKDFKTRGAAQFSMIFSNNGFLGIPLVAAVFSDAPLVMVSVVIINILTNVFMYTLGIYLISGDKKNISPKKIFLNPCLIAFIIGMVINLTGLNDSFGYIGEYSKYLTGIVTPLSMTILGIKLGGINISDIFKKAINYYVSLIKLVILPVIVTGALLLIRFFVSVPEELIYGIFIAYAMPAASMSTTFADAYNGDSESTVSFTLGTTVLSVLTISLLFFALNTLI